MTNYEKADALKRAATIERYVQLRASTNEACQCSLISPGQRDEVLAQLRQMAASLFPMDIPPSKVGQTYQQQMEERYLDLGK